MYFVMDFFFQLAFQIALLLKLHVGFLVAAHLNLQSHVHVCLEMINGHHNATLVPLLVHCLQNSCRSNGLDMPTIIAM